MATDVRLANAALARASKTGDPVKINAARSKFNEAKLEKAVREALAVAPPLTAAQRERVARLLLAGGGVNV